MECKGYEKITIFDQYLALSRTGIFQDLEHGWCQPTLGGPFPSFSYPLPFPHPSPSHLSLLSPEAGGVLCESWGGINPLGGGVGNSLISETMQDRAIVTMEGE